MIINFEDFLDGCSSILFWGSIFYLGILVQYRLQHGHLGLHCFPLDIGDWLKMSSFDQEVVLLVALFGCRMCPCVVSSVLFAYEKG